MKKACLTWEKDPIITFLFLFSLGESQISSNGTAQSFYHCSNCSTMGTGQMQRVTCFPHTTGVTLHKTLKYFFIRPAIDVIRLM